MSKNIHLKMKKNGFYLSVFRESNCLTVALKIIDMLVTDVG